MKLLQLNITDFKNIASASLNPAPKLNCILGDNGMGKTNLLDAVHYLSLGRSMASLPDIALVRAGAGLFMLRGVYAGVGPDNPGEAPETDEVTAAYRPGTRKSLRRNGREYRRFSDHVGLLPLVTVSPPDMEIVTGAGAERRRFLDMLISQGSRRYLDALIRYQRLLQQRNAMLRAQTTDVSLYAAVEGPMAAAAASIAGERKTTLQRLAAAVGRYYNLVAGDEREKIEIAYQPSVPGLDTDAGALAEAFERNRARDAALGHTSAGPHRDDLSINLRGMAMQRTASQGQAKTMAVVMRLAQYDYLAKASGRKPMLLLDDIFDKLDAGRVERIIGLVADDAFGQIFVTDTQRHHLENVVARVPGEHRVFTARDGGFQAL